jgi:DNA-binding response OmpR family regulator
MSTVRTDAVLYVEDEALVREMSVMALEDAGFVVVRAENGAAALEALDDDASSFCVVVTDIDLGAGPNGWDVARRARELNGSMPVIYLTGAASADWQAQGVRNSVLIGKPFTPTELVGAVGTILKRRGTTR